MGRFTSVDPLADKFPNQSPYLYAYNNPVRYIDVNGMYGDEKESNTQRDLAIQQGLKVGGSYQSGKEWGFNVVSGEDSYSSFNKDFSQNSNSCQSNLNCGYSNSYNGLGYGEYSDELLSGAGAYAKGLKHNGGYVAYSSAKSGNGLYWKPNSRGLNNIKGTSINVSKGLKGAGFLLGVAVEVPEIYYGYQTNTHEGNKQTAGAVGSVGGGTLGGMGAGALLGLAGIETGPGVFITITIGAALGGYYGEEKIEQVYDKFFRKKK